MAGEKKNRPSFPNSVTADESKGEWSTNGYCGRKIKSAAPPSRKDTLVDADSSEH